jgi:mRNA interferase RelE/StbE
LATYSVEFRPAALRELRALPKATAKRIVSSVEKLAAEPFPPGVKKLAGRENLYRIRVGDYRVLYEVHKTVLVILLVRIAHRREVYR